MAESKPEPVQRADGSLWLQVDPASPLAAALKELEVVRERQRWMAAPEFSRRRWLARPSQRRIGWLRAAWIMARESLRPRDEAAERLRDIEDLILGGHNDAADIRIARLRADYPGEVMQARVAALASLNFYDRGEETAARIWHEVALICGTAHPAMIEIFGETVTDHWAD